MNLPSALSWCWGLYFGPEQNQQKLSSKVACSRLVNSAKACPGLPSNRLRRCTSENAPSKPIKYSNSVSLFALACALTPRQGPLCALFLLCPGVRRCRRCFRGVGPSRPSAHFLRCCPLHLWLKPTLCRFAYLARMRRASRITFNLISAKTSA